MSGPTSLRAKLAPVLPIVVCLLLWEGMARGFGSAGSVLPPVSLIFLDAVANHQALAHGVVRTLTETSLGFLAGAAFGLLAGALFAEAPVIERMFFPLFIVSQTVPVVAFGAVIIIWFGNGLLAKVIIAFYLTFFPVTVNTHRGLLGVDVQSVNLLKSFGASPWAVFWKLRVPAALPSIMASLLLGISLSLIGAIVGEWFGDTVGLGILLIQAMYAENMIRLWTVIFCCGLLGSTLYGALAWIGRRYVWWGKDI
jgi:NitT/TauT family transport system permease protein